MLPLSISRYDLESRIRHILNAIIICQRPLPMTPTDDPSADGGNVSVLMNNYQMQPYNVKEKFSAAVQCVNWIR